MQNQKLSVALRMSAVSADHRRYCGYDEATGVVDGGFACACAGCINHVVSLDEFKQWIKDGRPILHFPVRFKIKPEVKLKAVKFVMENHSCNAGEALKFIERGIWSPGMGIDSYYALRRLMHDLFVFELVCPNDSNMDGDCQFCHKDQSCPIQNA